MFEWCENRLDITGKSVCLDVFQQWVVGNCVPHYRHAIQQSIQLFLAGCAGILKPVKSTVYPPYPGLISHGIGSSSTQNQAFEQWLGLLQKDAVLNDDTIRSIERIYHQSGIGAVKWENVPLVSRGIISDILVRQYEQWFGLVGIDDIDVAKCWERLMAFPDYAQPCDMLLVLPTRLATELNGNGELLTGIPGTSNLYSRLLGMEWPVGQKVRYSREGISSLTVLFDSPRFSPSGDLIAVLSRTFDCLIQHTYIEPGTTVHRYDSYDQGEHVDSGTLLPESDARPVLYLVNDDTPTGPTPAGMAVGQ
ncbi:DUF1281 domain-containing protein [Dickeya fangzhongdai]|uniref:DUF1281 domain-containing protein n=1 Tax=Dickeya fangzhongdai TaxID=1778540 RepID=UPI002B25A861|nr:DUF1281 domain-containing protein [Dickeya fangzhongdai]WOY03127.1 DUF1281 domain-containing protein [Dickeya fangzhongdai]